VGSELAIVRSIGFSHRLRTPAEEEDFEQELVDQWALALAAAGGVDSHVASQRNVAVEFARFTGHRLWSAQPEDGDRFLRWLRVERHQQAGTVIYEGALGVKSAGRFLSGSVAPRRGVGGAVR